MKKNALYGLMASVSMVSAAAYADDNTTLTTKNYVDSGLRAVYQAANEGLATKADASSVNTALAGKADASTVTALSNVVNGDGENNGLVQTVAALQAVVGGEDYSSLTTKVTTLENIVSDNENGLVNQVSGLQTAVAGKADADTVSALQETVAGKASQSDLDTLTGVVSGENGLTSQVSALQTTVDGKADADTVSTLQTTVGQLQTAIENVDYTGENGVTVNNETRKIGLAITNAIADTPYVYKNGEWSVLETVNEWNPNILY